MFLQVGTYIGSGYVIEIDVDSTTRNYQILSLYTIEDGPYKGSYTLTIKDIYTSTGNPENLFNGLLAGDGNQFSGADGYTGTVTITADEEGNPTTAVYVQPSDSTTPTTAFFQKQCLAPFSTDSC
jgi:hypothetical protein